MNIKKNIDNGQCVSPGVSPFPKDRPPARRWLGVKKRSTGRSRRRPREVAEPATMKFVFAGWLGGRPRIACESRADGSPAHGEAFRVYGRSRRRRGVARSSQRRSRTGSNANEAQLSSSAGCGTARIALKRRADGPPAPPARLPALRTFPRDCRPTRAALGGGTGGGSCVRSRTSSCGRGVVVVVVLAGRYVLALMKSACFVRGSHIVPTWP